MLKSQRLSYKYAFVAYIFFGLQGLVASGGAIDIVFPNLVLPISFAAGRAFHLNISIFWPLIGMVGAIYFFFCQEAEQEIYSARLININFWLLVAATWLILGSLLFGYNAGREYLEAVLPLRLAVAASTLILGYNLTRSYLGTTVPRSRATLVSMLTGSLTLIFFYLPNIISYAHPTLDELAKFMVVHLWEEMALELMGTGVLAALLIRLTGAQRRVTEAAVYLDMMFVALAGVLATGHHYYWVGTPTYWLWVGGFFSSMQILPSILLLYAALKSAKFGSLPSLSHRDKITAGLIGCSMFYHITGASLLGFFMAYPPINRFIHGTYITSAHSHLALFGVFGFLVLAVCFYILFSELVLTDKLHRWCWLAIILLNAGLLTMGLGLLLAGGLQTYFWRVIGLSIGETNQLIRPYLFVRMLGGFIYAAGSTILTFVVLKTVWPNIKTILLGNGQLSKDESCNLRQLHRLVQCLVQKQKEAERLLEKIRLLLRQLANLREKANDRNKCIGGSEGFTGFSKGSQDIKPIQAITGERAPFAKRELDKTAEAKEEIT